VIKEEIFFKKVDRYINESYRVKMYVVVVVVVFVMILH